MSSENYGEAVNNMNIQRMFQRIEHDIKIVNSEEISRLVGGVSKETFNELSRTAAQFRAQYLKKAIMIKASSDVDIAHKDIVDLRKARLVYEEAEKGFSALKHALKKGYFSLD